MQEKPGKIKNSFCFWWRKEAVPHVRFLNAACMRWVEIPARFDYESVEDIVQLECVVIPVLVFV
jgi:hypothetical protein